MGKITEANLKIYLSPEVVDKCNEEIKSGKIALLHTEGKGTYINLNCSIRDTAEKIISHLGKELKVDPAKLKITIKDNKEKKYSDITSISTGSQSLLSTIIKAAKRIDASWESREHAETDSESTGIDSD